jgi:hypothetical protein
VPSDSSNEFCNTHKYLLELSREFVCPQCMYEAPILPMIILWHHIMEDDAHKTVHTPLRLMVNTTTQNMLTGHCTLPTCEAESGGGGAEHMVRGYLLR